MIGCFIPTYRRPDLIRQTLLNLAMQEVKPDIVCVHQNATYENYEYIIKDIQLPFRVIWIFTERGLYHDEWYTIPLERLIEEGCEYYFWMDHDDIYYANHIKQSLQDLTVGDFRVATMCDMLAIDQNKHYMQKNIPFNIHAAGGQSSSMAFNRAFAIEALKDIKSDHAAHSYTDQIIADVTMPKFRCIKSPVLSTCYVAHKGSFTSAAWVDGVLSNINY